MGHTFLFRGEPNGRADSLAWWLSVLSADAMLLSETAGGDRTLVKLAGAFESLQTERRRKGREKYQDRIAEMIEKLSAHIEAMTVRRGYARIYPSLARHLTKKSQYALRSAKCSEAPLVCGASAVKEVSLGLSLVCDIAQLCPQYLDPSEHMMMRRARELKEVLEDKCARAICYEAESDGYLPFLAEADEAVAMYRRFLSELNVKMTEKRLLSVFPPSFLVWADGTCALVHRLLKRLSSGKSVCAMADEDDGLSAEETMRASELIPMTILAEHSEEAVKEDCEEGHAMCDKTECVHDTMTEAIAVETETVAEGRSGEASGSAAASEPREDSVADDMMSVSAEAVAEEIPPTEGISAQIEVSSLPEKIYAKASDYKNIVAKAVQKGRKHTAPIPRPLGKRR